MKTSNKLILAASGAFLLFVAGNSVGVLREYDASKDYAQSLLAQLDTTSVRTLSVEGDAPYWSEWYHGEGAMSLSLRRPPEPETIRIGGDTLYVAQGAVGGYYLPYPESYLLNGQPQPLPEEE